jgi:diguanylate cyclase (GGDEF)-like protein/PAS domain S-box-containing protein
MARAWRHGYLVLGVAAAILLTPGVLLSHAMGHHERDAIMIGAAAVVGALLVLAWVQRLLVDVGVLKRAEERLRRSEADLEQAQRLAHLGSWTWDLTTDEVTWSAEVYRIFGIDQAALGASFAAFERLVHPEDRQRVLATIQHAAEQATPFRYQCRVVRPDGRQCVLEARGEAVVDEQGRVSRMIGTAQEITDRERAAEAIARLASVVESFREAIIGVTLEGVVVSWNRGAERLFGVPAGEMLGRPLGSLVPPDLLDDSPALLEQVASGGMVEDHETLRLRPDGQCVPVALTISPIKNGVGAIIGASLIARDITKQRQLEGELTRQALYDPLTGLANRALLHDRLVHALARAEPTGERLALLVVDLDEFKLVNDSLGRAAGDRLLAAVAARLETCARPTDTVARLDGDEFGILLEEAGAGDAIQAAERMLSGLQAPVEVDGTRVVVRASIGIAEGDGGWQDTDALLRDANIAMYAAKRTGMGGYEIFDASMRTALLDRVELDAELRHAVDAGQFRLHYQPIVALGSGEVVGYEALLRWAHPARGLIPPDQFVPRLEDLGLIIPVGRWVLDEACVQAAAWQTRSGRALSIGVNVSPRQLNEPDFLDQVTHALATTGLRPASLTLEITERVMVADPDQTIGKLHAIQSLGVHVAVDDFGTGYSSLAYLQTLPVDTVKIDRSFTARIDEDPERCALAEAIVKLGHTLALAVVAEGIETSAQAAILRAIGCEFGQGYYFAKPQDPATVQASLPQAPAASTAAMH